MTVAQIALQAALCNAESETVMGQFLLHVTLEARSSWDNFRPSPLYALVSFVSMGEHSTHGALTGGVGGAGGAGDCGGPGYRQSGIPVLQVFPTPTDPTI